MRNLNIPESRKAATAAMPNLVPAPCHAVFQQVSNDFIKHPTSFPLKCRRDRSWFKWRRSSADPPADLGLCFTSVKPIPIGSAVELEIPLRRDIQRFHGTVVLVRETTQGYEIGLWLANRAEAARARIVEEICYLECRLQAKRRSARISIPSLQELIAIN